MQQEPYIYLRSDDGHTVGVTPTQVKNGDVPDWVTREQCDQILATHGDKATAAPQAEPRKGEKATPKVQKQETSSDPDRGPFKKTELYSRDKQALVTLAERNNIELRGDETKKDIVDMLTAKHEE